MDVPEIVQLLDKADEALREKLASLGSFTWEKDHLAEARELIQKAITILIRE